MNTININGYSLTIFGESHNTAIGCIIDGILPGIILDISAIESALLKRSPKSKNNATKRIEEDKIEILSGIYQGKTTGAPLTIVIYNKDIRSKDYEAMKNIPRPSHSDYGAFVKYEGNNDNRGGGMFSGRLTVALVCAGEIARQELEYKGYDIGVGSEILSIKDCTNKDRFDEIIEEAKCMGDSLGGIIRIKADNIPAGIGRPYFHSLESELARLIFSIPSIKGVEFGKGFEISKLYGSEANDEMYYENDKVKMYSNNNGGIVGGISNGADIEYSVVVKPTPSISISQRSIDMKNKKNTNLIIEGRHDTCIALRIGIVLESITYILLNAELNKNIIKEF